MPAAMAIATVAAGAISAGASIHGSRVAAKTSQRASDVEAKSSADAIAYEREQAAEDRRQFDTTEAARKAAWEADQQRQAIETAQNEPRRQMREAAYRSLADSLGIHVPDYQPPPQRPTQMPADWGLAPGTTPSPTSGGYAWSAPQPDAAAAPRSLATAAQSLTTDRSGSASELAPLPQPDAWKTGDPNTDPRTLGAAVRFRRQYQRSV